MRTHSIRWSLLSAVAVAVGVLPAAAETHIVNQVGLTYIPDVLTITAGDTIEWVWSAGSHTVTEGTPCTASGGFDQPLNSMNPRVVITFNTPGSIDYFCRPHCATGQDGLITVQPCPGAGGDMNEDGAVDGHDIQSFVDAVLSVAPQQSEICDGDFNANSNLDVGDIPGLVSALLS